MHSSRGNQIFSVNSFSGSIFRNCLSLFLLLCIGCGGLAVSVDAPSETQAEPHLPLGIAWTYNARAGFGPDAPQIFDNSVMVATRQGTVHFIDVVTGRRGGNKRFGDAINGSPAVIGNTLIVPLAGGRMALAAYDLDRADMRWRLRGDPIQVGVTALESGGIYVNTAGEVRRFEIDDGAVVWTHQIEGRARVHASPLVHHQLVIVVIDNGTVLALSLNDGSQQWSVDVGSPIYVAPEIYGEMLLVSTTRGSLFAMDVQKGDIHWNTTLADETVQISSPTADHELVVAGASDGVLRVFDLDTGEMKWSAQCSDALAARPLITSEVIYTGSMGNWFYAFDRHNGDLLQQIELRGRVKSAMALAEGGLIILTEPRYVVRLTPLNTDVHL
ncbi:MAG: PQQ-binding-like beta-propeller repeat protein [Bacteroidetes bacterium]|nr:PQQ-binding-like beta-propeller repeat protein [Bacteroidota bacterium]